MALITTLRARLQRGAAQPAAPPAEIYRVAIESTRATVAERLVRAPFLRPPDPPGAAGAAIAALLPRLEDPPPRPAIGAPARGGTSPAMRAATRPAPLRPVIEDIARDAKREAPAPYVPRMQALVDRIGKPRTPRQSDELREAKRAALTERMAHRRPVKLGLGKGPMDLANGALSPARGMPAQNLKRVERSRGANQRNVPDELLDAGMRTRVVPRPAEAPAPAAPTVLDEITPADAPLTVAVATGAGALAETSEAPTRRSEGLEWGFLAAAVGVAWLLFRRAGA